MAATAAARTARTAKATAPARRVATPSRRTTSPARRTTAPRPRSAAPKKHTPVTGFVPVAAAAGAVSGIADSGIFVWLTRGRLWIGLLGALLVGIVGLNVLALGFSASSSNAAGEAENLARENSALRAKIATTLSSEQVQSTASHLGLAVPEPGAIRYVKPAPGDAADAAKRLRDGDFTVSAYTAPVPPPTDTTVAPTATATTADPAAAATTVTSATPIAPVTTTPADPTATATTPPATDPTATTSGAVTP